MRGPNTWCGGHGTPGGGLTTHGGVLSSARETHMRSLTSVVPRSLILKSERKTSAQAIYSPMGETQLFTTPLCFPKGQIKPHRALRAE